MRLLAALRPFLGKDSRSRKRCGGPICMLGFRLLASELRNLFMTGRGLMRSGRIEARARAKLRLADGRMRPSPRELSLRELGLREQTGPERLTAPLIELFRRY